jgi:hypothetical protein
MPWFYNQKSEPVEAIQYTGINLEELRRFVPEIIRDNRIGHPPGIHTIEGTKVIHDNDWVVRNMQDQFSICDDGAFKAEHKLKE